MARFRKATPVRDHLPGILAGVVSALLVAFIIWAAPAVKGGLSDSEDPPQVESVTPDQEKGPEAQKLGDRLLTARKNSGLCFRIHHSNGSAGIRGKTFRLDQKVFLLKWKRQVRAGMISSLFALGLKIVRKR